MVISTEERVEGLKDVVIGTGGSGTALGPRVKSLYLVGRSLRTLRKCWFPPTLLQQRPCLVLRLVLQRLTQRLEDEGKNE